MTQAQIVGKNIKNLREGKNWSQDDLAQKLNITRKAISAWETGRACPRMGVVEQLKAIFNCKTSDIISDHEPLNFKVDAEYYETYGYAPEGYFEKTHNISAEEAFGIDTENEQRLLKIYRKLDKDGKRKLLDYSIDLVTQ